MHQGGEQTILPQLSDLYYPLNDCLLNVRLLQKTLFVTKNLKTSIKNKRNLRIRQNNSNIGNYA